MSGVALIIQQDGSLILNHTAPAAASVADGLRRFALLEKCLEPFHYYRLTNHSLWNAAAAGVTTERILDFLTRASQSQVPPAVATMITAPMARYGQVWLRTGGSDLLLEAASSDVLETVRVLLPPAFLAPEQPESSAAIVIEPAMRGLLKAHLARHGWPVRDDAGYQPGLRLDLNWQPTVALRPYQREAITAFLGDDENKPGPVGGLIVLPCGAGKTVVGVGAVIGVGQHTLVLCPHATAVQQWLAAFRTFTNATSNQIGEYDAKRAALQPITVTTYQMLVARRAGAVPTPHLARLGEHPWGLVIFDEAHLLPADIFRLAADLSTRRRLGLTATPVREDGREVDLAALIGPTLVDLPWSQLAAEGWIAPVQCTEVRVALREPPPPDVTHRALATAWEKWLVVRRLVQRHAGAGILVIGHYLDQLHDLADRLGAPLISGNMPRAERDAYYQQFRQGDLPVLVLSRVGNVAIDLPNASVAIEVSGNYGSRQEEAQRLGRLLRPKPDTATRAHWYLVVADHPAELSFAARRQRFLVEQGYRYRIVHA